MYGNNPRKLLNIIIENKEIKIKVAPKIELFPIKVLNSLCNVIIILIQVNEYRLGINQNEIGIIRIPKIVLSQFKDKLKEVEGSNVENKFAIIFN